MIQRILVVGTGTMGGGIAQVAAQAGCMVKLYDQSPDAASAARQRIADSLKRAADKGYVDAATVPDTLARLTPVDALDSVGDVDAVIEAVKEDLDVKRAVFAALEAVVPSDAALWSNTSTIPITRIAEGLKYPRRVAGTHFFNPVPRMRLVEVIAGAQTDEAVVALAERTMLAWGKTPVRAPDTPGFIVNRIFDAIKREALQLLEEGAPVDQVDTAVKLGLNFPMGPFEVMDLVGLDTTYHCLQKQAEAMGRSQAFGTHLPNLVRQRKLGRKTGEGFYQHQAGTDRPIPARTTGQQP